MPEQGFIIPDSPASGIMYGSSAYLWVLMLLFILATLIVIYLVLGIRTRSVKKARQKEEGEEERASIS